MSESLLDRGRDRMMAVFVAVAALLAFVAPSGRAASADLGETVEVVVQALNPFAARQAVERHGGEVTYDLPIIDAVVADVPAAMVPGLAGDTSVRAVTPNAPMHVQGITPPHEAAAVYSKVVGADKLWFEGVKGAGATVALVDTGIAPVPDLAGRVIGRVDFTTEMNPFTDSFGHGTFVAGVIAGNGSSSDGRYTGVAPAARLVSIKIAGRNGATDVVQVLKGLQWAVTMKPIFDIEVLNLSVGSDSAQPYALSPLDRAVEAAWQAGITVVVSASNLGEKGPGTITKPADDPFVITVGAIDDKGSPGRGDDQMAGFSGMGPTAADGIAKPEVVASGRSLVSLRAPGSFIDERYPAARIGTGYFKGSGTSHAAGIVSGAAALLLDREQELNPNQVKARLMNTAVQVSGGGPNVSGSGSIDAYSAAHAGTFDEANQNIPVSLGVGSISDDEGSLSAEIHTTSVTNLLGTFYSSEWVADPTGSSWWGSSWWGSSWWGSSWWGSSWWGSSWWGGWE